MSVSTPFLIPDHLVVKVIGIGSAGVCAVDYMCQHGLENIECGFIDNDLASLSALPYRHLFPIPFKEDPQCFEVLGASDTKGWLHKVSKDVRSAFATIKSKLDAFLNNTDLLIVVSPQGGQTGGLFAPIVTQHARKKAIHTVLLSSQPAHTDWHASLLASATQTLLDPNTVDAYHMPSLEAFTDRDTQHLNTEAANAKLFEDLQNTLTLLEPRAQLRLDMDTFRTIFANGQPITIESGSSPICEPNAIRHALYQLGKVPYDHKRWIPDTAVLYFLGDPAITFGELTEAIRGADLPCLTQALPMLGFFCSPVYQGEARFVMITTYQKTN